MPSITLIPGDGIGPEIVSSVRAIFSAMNIPLEINEAIAGGAALADGLDLIPQETLAQIERSDATLKGPITTPIGRGFSSVNVSLRQHFNLFANVRPVLSLPGTKARDSTTSTSSLFARTLRDCIQGLVTRCLKMVKLRN